MKQDKEQKGCEKCRNNVNWYSKFPFSRMFVPKQNVSIKWRYVKQNNISIGQKTSEHIIRWGVQSSEVPNASSSFKVERYL